MMLWHKALLAGLLLQDFTTPSASASCGNAFDCQLLGECVQGQCVCDPGWEGEHCSALRQGHSRVIWPSSSDGGTSGSWGASVLQIGSGEQRQLHLFADVTCLSNTCAHTNGAQIIHAMSQNGSIFGPYSFLETAIPAEIENVHAALNPDGMMLLFYGDHEFKYPNQTCTGTGQDGIDRQPGARLQKNPPYPRGVKRMGIAYKGLEGIWQYHFPKYDAAMKNLLPLWNPSPLVFPNGTVLLAFRTDRHGPSDNGLAIADTWQGPYRLLSTNATPGLHSEDPNLFLNKRGFHLILHCYRGHNTGCHSFSSDGVHWTVSPDPVYNTSVWYANGTRHDYQYRERPELVFGEGGVPKYLLTGVEWGSKGGDYGGCASFSIATKVLVGEDASEIVLSV